jgi:hypothetical protein
MKKKKPIRWKKSRPLLQKILGKFHIASLAGFIISLTLGMAIVLLITGLVWFYVTWQNDKCFPVKTEIQYP